MSDLIDNKSKILAESIENILPSSSKLDILVGYFYFSGFRELYKELKDKKIRIIVGKEINQDILHSVKSINELEDPPEDPESMINPHRSLTGINRIPVLKDGEFAPTS